MITMLTPMEFERQCEQRALALKAAQPPTPAHSAAAAANEYADDAEENEDAQRRRRRVQHEIDPYMPDAPEVEQADLGKRFTQAHDALSGYPVMGQVSPEAFHRGPVTAGEATYGPGYAGFAPDAHPVRVPSATVSAAVISRPLITDGQSSPCAPGEG